MRNEEEMTGTTIMAIKYDKGVIIGADTRTTMGTYIPNNITDKLSIVAPKIFFCRSGSSADTQAIAKIVETKLKTFESMNLTSSTVRRATMMAKSIIYEYPNLLASLIIAGVDENEGGAIYTVNLGGSFFSSEWALGGSGSGYIYGLVDSTFQSGMNLEEGIAFVKRAVGCAIKRDVYSGGCIRIAAIPTEGEILRYFVPGNSF